MSIPRLGVNVDHVATIRNARGEYYPRPIDAANMCIEAGADQITIHLREDRRHIVDDDVAQIKDALKKLDKPLNLEIGLADDIVDIAIKTQPDWICVVPEKREERTTEGGLDLRNDEYFHKVKTCCERIHRESPQTKISLFVEADEEVLKRCFACEVEAVEIHTGEYAKDFLEGRSIDKHIEAYKLSQKLCDRAGVGHHAGHGLTDASVVPLLENKLFVEYNIGHWIIAESIFKGLGSVVHDLSNLFQKSEL